MAYKGVAGFQRAELAVQVELASSGLAADENTLAQPSALQTLEMQGLPQIVEAAAERSLGADGAKTR